MRIFSCNHCGHTLFFENVQCLNCGSQLAFLPDRLALCAIEPAGDEAQELWRVIGENDGPTWRQCQNQLAHGACNFAVASDDPQRMCVSCRQTRLAPDLSVPGNTERWMLIEVAKRRLYYALARLDLVRDHGASLVFEFLADLPGGPPVMTGHQGGVITLNVAEADDDERARRRVALREPYRTLLGHLRHESGHYFWDRLILQQGRVDSFRALFGDEQQDYGTALANYYSQGGATDWQGAYVSGYATAHPWEDWAETWAHYLHMVDLLETAAAYRTTLTVPGDGNERTPVADPFAAGPTDFDALVSQWTPVTLLLNSLNRSLGQGDAYPFALTPGALQKLRFVHDVITAQGQGAGAADSPAPGQGEEGGDAEGSAASVSNDDQPALTTS